MNKPRFNPKARRKSRELALQAIYQWQLSGNNIKAIEQEFLQDQDNQQADKDYFSVLIEGITASTPKLDEMMLPYLDRSLTDLNPVELAIMRIGVFELLYRDEIPYRVIINEALELAKKFGAQEGHKYVNGVLDKIAKDHRKDEAINS